MKRLSFLTILTVLLVCAINAQVQQQATMALISLPESPAADPFLCFFGNTIEDIALIDHYVDIDGKEPMFLRQREDVNLNQTFAREFQRLNVRFLSVHTIQRRFSADRNPPITTYFIVDIYERVGSRYYLVASNRY